MPPEIGEHRAHDLLHALFLADVGGVAARAAARVRDLARDRFELVGLAADQRDARAERGQFMRRAAPDAAAGAGHDAGLAGEQAVAKNRLKCPGHGASEFPKTRARKALAGSRRFTKQMLGKRRSDGICVLAISVMNRAPRDRAA